MAENKIMKKPSFSKEMAILSALTLVGGCMRAYMIGSPRTIVYDESYMGVIVNNYRRGEHFFDIHPPFTRLLHYYASQFLLAPECPYSKDMKWAECDMWQMRSVSLVLGALLIPLTYLACRLHGGSALGGLIAAFLITFDNMMFSLSRIHLLDMVTLCCIACTVCAHAAVLNKLRVLNKSHRNVLTYTLENLSTNYDILVLMVLDGIAIGCAVSSKFGVAIPTALWCVVCVVLHTAKQCYDKIKGASSGSKSSSYNPIFTLLFNGFIVLVVITSVAIFTYVFLLYWHFSMIAWKQVEEGSYTAYALTKKKLMKQTFSAIDRIAERLLLSIDFKYNKGGVLEKIVEFTLDQYYYYVLLDTYELEIPRLPNSHHSHGSMLGWLFSSRGLLHALFSKYKAKQTQCSGILFIPNVLLCWCVTLAVFGYVLHKCYLIMSHVLPSDDEEEEEEDLTTKQSVNNKTPPNNYKNQSQGSFSSKQKNSRKKIPKEEASNKLSSYFIDEEGGDGVGSGALVIGWAMHLLPFMSVHRELFIIYYVFAYYFGIIYLALCFDKFAFYLSPNRSFFLGVSSGVVNGDKDSSVDGSVSKERKSMTTNSSHYLSIGIGVISVFMILFFISFMYIRPLNTGELEPVQFLNRMAIVSPSCWSGQCFNSPPGTPFRTLVDQVGGDDRLIFPYLISLDAM